MSDIKTIYHGSIEIVQKPKYRAGKTDNDYGMGFYCTEDNRARNSFEDLSRRSFYSKGKTVRDFL